MGAVRDLIAYDNLFLTLTCMHVFQTFFTSSFFFAWMPLRGSDHSSDLSHILSNNWNIFWI